MIVFLTLVGVALSVLSVFLVNYRLKTKALVKGWTLEAVPHGAGYYVTVRDPDGEQWGYTGYDTKIPVMLSVHKSSSYSSGAVRNKWYTGNPRWANRFATKCARKKAKNESLAARQKVVKTL